MSYAHNQPEFMVSELAGRIKRLIEDEFGHVRVRGEVSKCHVNGGSGHAYITLKDDKAVIEAVCWRGTFSKLNHKPEAGLEVIATGRLTTYGPRSQYQLVIESVEPAGEGALMAMLEARKKQLAKEGLFEAARKKPIPFLPQVIGVITSPTGAVIRDILHRISDRFPSRVLLWPVLVQGEGAAEQVAAAIDGFHQFGDQGTNKKFPKPDLIIVARGGGSIEDLWAFNEEVVVRAVANASIPIISAVGHETDTTLIDYASDWRAPTPTAAAEKAVPVRQELALLVQEHGAMLGRSMLRKLDYASEKLTYHQQSLARFPRSLQEKNQRLDELATRLQTAPMRGLDAKASKLVELGAFIRPRALEQTLQQSGRLLTERATQLNRAMEQWLKQAAHRLEMTESKLRLLDVSQVLKRGFAMAKDANGKPVTSAAAASSHASLELVFHDNSLPVFTDPSAALKPSQVAQKSTRHKRKKPSSAQSDAAKLQESLF